MTYLVIELHPAYAVLMDEAGRFVKAANLNYQVGDTVRDIIEWKEPDHFTVTAIRSLGRLAAAAACFCLIFFGVYRPNFMSYGTVRLKINPDVLLTVTRSNRVIGLEGLNEDGVKLVEGYLFKGKTNIEAADDLADRAIDMGYLTDNREIRIAVDSRNPRWKAAVERDILEQMQKHFEDSGSAIMVRIDSSLSRQQTQDAQPESSGPPSQTVTSPVRKPAVTAGKESDDDEVRDDENNGRDGADIGDDDSGKNDDDHKDIDDRKDPDDHEDTDDRKDPVDHEDINDREDPDDHEDINDREGPDDHENINDREDPDDHEGINDRKGPDDHEDINDRDDPDDHEDMNDREDPDDHKDINDRKDPDDHEDINDREGPDDYEKTGRPRNSADHEDIDGTGDADSDRDTDSPEDILDDRDTDNPDDLDTDIGDADDSGSDDD